MNPDERKTVRVLIGLRIRAARTQSGLTQRELAAHFNARESYVRAIETGDKQTSILRLVEIANLLCVPTSALVADL